MAQPWMKIELPTPNKVEVFQMSELLNIDPDCVLGKLFRVWGWFNEHSTDGVEPISVVKILNNLVRNDYFCDAMAEVGWLIINKKNIKIPNFELHNSKGAKQRALAARRQEKYRDKQVLQIEHNDNVTLDTSLDKNRLEEIRIDKSSSPVEDAIEAKDTNLDLFKDHKENNYE